MVFAADRTTSGAAHPSIVLLRAGLGPDLARHLPESIARRERVVPVARTTGDLELASLDLSEEFAERLSLAARCPVVLRAAFDAHDIDYGLETVYGTAASARAVRDQAVATNLVRLSYLDAGTLRSVSHDSPAKDGLLDRIRDAELVSDEAIAEATALTLHLPYVQLGLWSLQTSLLQILPQALAERWEVAPIGIYRGRLLVGLSTADALPALPEISRAAGFPVAPVIASRSAVRSAQRIAWGTVEVEDSPAPDALHAGTTSRRTAAAGGEGSVAAVHAPASKPPAGLRTGAPGKAAPGLGVVVGIVQRARRAAQLRVDPTVARSIPGVLAERLGALPVRSTRAGVVVAVQGRLRTVVRELLESLFRRPIIDVVVTPVEHRALADHWFSGPLSPPEVIWPELGWAGEESFDRFLVSLGYVTAGQVAAIRRNFERQRRSLPSLLLESGAVTENALTEALGLWLGVPLVQVEQWIPDAEVRSLVAREFVRRHGVLPVFQSGGTLLVALASPDSRLVLPELEALTGRTIRVAVAHRSAVARALRRWFDEAAGELSVEFVRVSEALVRDGKITPAERAYFAEVQLRSDATPDQTAERLGLVTEEQFARATADALGFPHLDLTPDERFTSRVNALGEAVTVRQFIDPVQPSEARLITESMARSDTAIPVLRQAGGVVVAFAWPSADRIAALAEALEQPVVPVAARRSQVEAAIARHLGRPRLGDALLQAGLVRSDQLDVAAALARRTGLHLGAALVSLGFVTEVQLTAHLAMQNDLPFFDLGGEDIDPEVARLIPKDFARERQVLPISLSEGSLLVAMVDPLDRELPAEIGRITGLRARLVMVTPSEFATAYQGIYREENITFSASALMTRAPEDSASRVLSDGQKLFIMGALVVVIALFAWQPIGFLVALVALTNLFYFTISAYKFYLLFNALGHSLEIDITPGDLAALDERDLPMYTILVPLYRETEVLPTLVAAIDRLDYPKAKLDVKLLLEEDDVETIRVAQATRLPSHFQIMVVPHGLPKGKPKACNYGLLQARGTYTVIFDAEDVPDPDQLKKVVLAFRKGSPKLGCVQCKLNYYNQNQNLLTRWFTSEYSMWFDLFLPGLDASHAPIPLGGTSNHFPTIVLQELGAWDPYNVTEDADLGIRIFKRGYTTAVVDSTTYEEANSEVYNWVRQRSRWVKGYIQTWLVHMRNPFALYRALGCAGFFSIQMTIFGTFFTFLVNPIFWGMTAFWFVSHWGLINELFPGPIFYAGSVSLFLGNFAFTYAAMMGCVYRGYYDLVKYNVIIVLYWYLMSWAAWKGFIQLFRNPFYWEKTVHGLYRGPVLNDGKGNGPTTG